VSGITRRNARSIVLALLLAVPSLVFGAPVASASADLVIESPATGTVTKEAEPTISGTSSDSVDEISVKVYSGPSASGSPVQTLTAAPTPIAGTWSVAPSPALAEGTYTVQAEQEELAGLGGTLVSNAPTFTIDEQPPEVTIEPIETPSKDATPSFAGTASEDGTVTVHVLKAGKEVASASGTASGGSWHTGPLGSSLPAGKYTADATEPSDIGNPEGTSKPVAFEVEVEPPTVTLESIKSPTGDTTPAFSGTASESSTVTVDVYRGASASGSPVASATAPVSGGSWTSPGVSPALTAGEYTAQATQESSRGGGPGRSGEDTFKVDTSSPKVTLNAIKSPMNDRTPAFSGTASADTPVVVDIYAGATATGTPVATATATGTEGAWTSSAASPELPAGEHGYTAEAHQESPLGNPEGSSEPVKFTLDTNAPTVTIAQLKTPSDDDSPSFSGTASEDGTVDVDVYEGPNLIATTSASASGGAWSTGKVSLSSSGEHTYTAIATEESSLGNGPGSSNDMSFEVDMNTPTVTIEQPATPTNDTTPTFSGTASEDTKVTVRISEGGKEVTTVSTTASGGRWTTGKASLPTTGDRTYTAVAKEASGLGNGEGTSNNVTFTVDTEAPKLTIEQPPTPSNDSTPSFKGTSTEAAPVTVHIFKGTTEVTSVSGTVGAGGAWSSGDVSALAEGEYTADATQPSSLVGNPPATSGTVSFTIDLAAPIVTVSQLKTPSNDDSPSFSGTASEAGTVDVDVYEGPNLVATTSATASGGTWSTGKVSLASTGEHTYTAVATEESSLGNGPGSSNDMTFVVDMSTPTVTLTQPATPTNETTQTLSGSASENTKVVVHVFEGVKEITSASTTASGGSWSVKATVPGGDHTYSADAKEVSGLGNGEGTSNTVTFTVDTEAPKLVIEQPPTPSNDATPSFKGTSTEAAPVTVRVYKGSTEVTSVTGTVSAGGAWSTGAVSPPLADGQYTAVATQPSSLSGNPEATSEAVSFTVDTKPPTLTLSQVKSPSNDSTPAFSGTTNEAGTVVVRVYEGPTEVASVYTTTGSGAWSTGKVALATSGDHAYTAVATEESSLGNGPGSSNDMSFEVDLNVPTVTINQPATPTNDTTPSFSGTASEDTKVTVHVYEGSKPVTTISTTASGGTWATGKVALPTTGDRSYNASATEVSAVGNEEGLSAPVMFAVDTEPPKLTLAGVPSPTNDTTPAFSGTTTEAGTVVVRVYEGSEAKGTEVASTSTAAPAGNWTTAAVSLPGGDHTYTAIATEVSPLGNEPGKSNSSTFIVDTNPPAVTLNQPASPSKSTTPTFSGKASEATQVIVHVYEGTKEVTSATTTASGGSWSVKATVPGGDHTYTAQAVETSGLGNEPGKSGVVTFVVDTEAPVLTLAQPATPSKDTTPSFSGETSEGGEVVVHVYSGDKAEGKEVTKVTATTTGGSWTTGAASLASGEHTYTAQATEVSALGNAEGASQPVTFVVDTDPPTVTLNPVASPSNDTTPTLSGSASEDTEVVVRVYEGKVGGTEVAKAQTTASAGKWSVPVTVPGGEHTYYAQATEASGLGNEPGKSGSQSFLVNTEAPHVTIEQTPGLSKNTSPTFSGTASENTEVTVQVFEGAKAEGTEVAKASTVANGGTWSVTATVPGGDHTYTAIAHEVSGLNNAPGVSGPDTFAVDTEPPTVTLNGLTSPSNDNSPSFSGSASESTKVVVRVYEGSTEVGSVSATASGGAYTTPTLTLASTGDHSYTAVAKEVSGLGNAEGSSKPIAFVVDKLPPTVALTQTTTPSKDATPTFSGTGSENNTEVVVRVYEGTEAKGTEVGKAIATVSGGTFTTPAVSLASGTHTYTAQATEASGIGNAAGVSAAETFVVDTEAPKVKLNLPTTPSNDTTPTFTGSAGEETEVTIHVYEGTKAEGTEVAKATTTAKGGSFSVQLPAPLAGGYRTYSAIAKEVSGLGNTEGVSNPVTFVLDTEAPKLAFSPSPPIESSETKPSFEGVSNETEKPEPVTVEVLNSEGAQIDKLTAQVSEKKWVTPHISAALTNGSYTVIAKEPSHFKGNPEGKVEASFTIVTGAPDVKLNEPTSPTNDTRPIFSGETNETGSTAKRVVVEVYEGEIAGGATVATAEVVPVKGKWQTSSLSSPLRGGDHTFTVVATEESAFDNATGESGARQFVLDTEPPKLVISQPPTPSNDTMPAFSGTASEAGNVVVHVFEGTREVTTTPVSSATISGSSALATWRTEKTLQSLPDGEYTAVAREESALKGNGVGQSEAVAFVVDTRSPTVTMNAITNPTSDRAPAFSGTASDHTPIVVEIYEKGGVAAGRAPVSSVEASGGEWYSHKISPALEFGHEYEAVAMQTSSIGNAPGFSSPDVFAVEAIPPIATTESAVVMSRTSAELKAYVNPNGGEVTTCELEYGTTTAYGSSAECAFTETAMTAFPSSGDTPISVFARVFGLAAGTTYHFRILASDEGGTSAGTDDTFTTQAPRFGDVAPPPEEPKGKTGTGGVASFIASELAAPPKSFTILKLLKHGVYETRFKSPLPGTAVIDWYYLPPGAKIGKKSKHPPVLVATGKLVFSSAKTATMKIRLTAAGRRLLAREKRIKITQTCVFTPSGAAAVKVTGSFELKR
jgi:large repetitive protein